MTGFTRHHLTHMNAIRTCLLLSLALLSMSAAAASEIRAITEDGRKVILTSDGLWRFDLRTNVPRSPIRESP